MMVSPLLADDADTVDVLGDDLDGGFGLTLTHGDGLQGLLLDGGVPLRLNVLGSFDPAEAGQGDGQRSHGQQAVRPRDQRHGAPSPRHWRYSACRRVASPPHRRAFAGSAQSLPWKKRQRSSSSHAPV